MFYGSRYKCSRLGVGKSTHLDIVNWEHGAHDALEGQAAGILQGSAVGQGHHAQRALLGRFRKGVAGLDDHHIVVHPVHPGGKGLMPLHKGMVRVSDDDVNGQASTDTVAQPPKSPCSANKTVPS